MLLACTCDTYGHTDVGHYGLKELDAISPMYDILRDKSPPVIKPLFLFLIKPMWPLWRWKSQRAMSGWVGKKHWAQPWKRYVAIGNISTSIPWFDSLNSQSLWEFFEISISCDCFECSCNNIPTKDRLGQYRALWRRRLGKLGWLGGPVENTKFIGESMIHALVLLHIRCTLRAFFLWAALFVVVLKFLSIMSHSKLILFARQIICSSTSR